MFSGGATVCVKKIGTNPRFKHSKVCNSNNVGIYITDGALGMFEDCEIAQNTLAGIWVKNRANPFFKRCHIHHGRDVGVFTFEYGMVCSFHFFYCVYLKEPTRIFN